MKWDISATRATASAVGVLTGLLGIEHGYFETLQGNGTPSSIIIHAIGPPCQPDKVWHGCEPAMTLIPNFFVTGVLAIIVGLLVILWSAAFVQRKNGGAVLFRLSIALLLVGGGLAPIPLGIIASATATRINAPLTWWRAHLSVHARRLLAKVWPWSFITSLVLFPVPFALGYLFPNNQTPALILNYLDLGLILLTVVTCFAYDIHHGDLQLATKANV